jgi:transcription elongation factor Elf1
MLSTFQLTMPYQSEGYQYGAPSLEIEELDGEIAEKIPCPKCNGSCHYEAWHKSGSYIALAVCNDCGHETAF